MPFSESEYQQRHQRVRQRMAEDRLDFLYVTDPANLCYLTGYGASWYPPRLPVGLLLAADREEVYFFDWDRHEDFVARNACYSEVGFMAYGDFIQPLLDVIAADSKSSLTIGLEWQSQSPNGATLKQLADGLISSGLQVIDADRLVDDIRLYKSPEELLVIRQAAAIADRAMNRLADDIRPGMTELDVSARLTGLLIEEGSGYAATPVLVASGDNAWCETHSFPSQRQLQFGDIVSVDCCATVHHYHGNLARTFVLGQDKTLAGAQLDVAAEAMPLLLKASVGSNPSHCLEEVQARVEAEVPSECIWWIGGYSLGIAFSPSWVGHAYLANEGVRKHALQPGFVSNIEIVFGNREQGYEAQVIDTLVVTEEGLELLSGLPRRLVCIPWVE